MKKVFIKSLSTFLTVIMLFSAIPMLVSAEEAIEAPVLTVDIVEETPTSLKLKLSLTEGSFSCLDAAVTVDGLTCTAAYPATDLVNFSLEVDSHSGAISNCQNKENGKISLSSTESFVAAMDLIIYEFTKPTAAGVNGSDVSLTVETCYISEDGQDVSILDSVQALIGLSETHEHHDLVWTVTNEPTCSAEGSKEATCPSCGETVETAVIAKTEHQHTSEDKVDATCTQSGYRKLICEDCKEVIEEETYPATGHGETRVERQEATCTQDGYRRVYCKDCGELLTDNVLPARNHPSKYTDTKEATCTENGYVRTYCELCKELLDEQILEATGHSEETVTDTKPATCTEAGYIRTYCKDCNELLDEQILEATGHSDETVTDTKPATCTEAGYVRTYCKACNELLDEQILEPTGHGESRIEKKDKTCTEDGYIRYYCTVCGDLVSENILKSEGHKYVNYEIAATCTADGHKIKECSVCHDVASDVLIRATGHNWTSWATFKAPTYRSVGIDRRSCKNCGDHQDREIPMIKVPVTGVKISMSSLSMNFKKVSRLYADVLPEEAAFSANIVWSSSNPKIVSVDEDGTITAKGPGTAVITASTEDGRFSDSCTVTVTYSWLQWIIVYILFGWIWYV